MFFLGSVADKKGVRKTLLMAFVLLLAGRVLISAAPTILGMEPDGLWSNLHITTLLGMVLIIYIPFSKILHFGGIFFTQSLIKRS